MKLKFNWVPFILSFTAIMGLRIFQIFSIGNAAIRVQWDNFEMICFVLGIAAFAIIFIMSYLSKDAPDVFVINKNVFTGLISIFTAIFIIWNSIYEFNAYLGSDNDWVRLFIGILGILAGVAFVFIGLTFIKEKNYFEKFHLLTLAPTFWAAVVLLKLFFDYKDIHTNMFHLNSALNQISLLFFLFAQSRLLSGLFNASTFKKLFYFGLPAILFMTISVTNYLAVAMDTGRKLSLIDTVTVATQVFLIFYVISIMFMVKTGENLIVEETEDTTVLVDKNESSENNDSTYEQPDMAKVDQLIEDIKNENANSDETSVI